jgi:uncharacterized membrane protein
MTNTEKPATRVKQQPDRVVVVDLVVVVVDLVVVVGLVVVGTDPTAKQKDDPKAL